MARERARVSDPLTTTTKTPCEGAAILTTSQFSLFLIRRWILRTARTCWRTPWNCRRSWRWFQRPDRRGSVEEWCPCRT